MSKSWFHHANCTTEEANALILQYQSRNIKTEKNLAADYKSWTVSALLSELNYTPQPSKRWAQPIWSRV